MRYDLVSVMCGKEQLSGIVTDISRLELGKGVKQGFYVKNDYSSFTCGQVTIMECIFFSLGILDDFLPVQSVFPENRGIHDFLQG